MEMMCQNQWTKVNLDKTRRTLGFLYASTCKLFVSSDAAQKHPIRPNYDC